MAEEDDNCFELAVDLVNIILKDFTPKTLLCPKTDSLLSTLPSKSKNIVERLPREIWRTGVLLKWNVRQSVALQPPFG